MGDDDWIFASIMFGPLNGKLHNYNKFYIKIKLIFRISEYKCLLQSKNLYESELVKHLKIFNLESLE